MKFPYKKLPYGVVRPIIPVEVRYKDKSVNYFALVDSGADISLFHEEIGKILGIDIENGKKGYVSGVTQGELQAYYIHEIELNVGGWPFKTLVGFMPTLSKNGHGLLGQKGFFDLFKSINFDYNKKEIEIKNK